MIQSNTFVKGLNFDIDVSMMPSQNYRYAENVRIIGNGTSFALTGRDYRYKFESTFDYGDVEDSRVIGSTVINNIGVIFIAKGYGTDTYNIVYRVDNIDSNVISFTKILSGDIGLCKTAGSMLSVVGNYESDSNIKVYFTDGESPINVLSVTDNKYAGTGSAASTDLIDINGDIKSINAISISGNVSMPQATISKMGIGYIPVGIVQYCYQLISINGNESALSNPTNLLHLTTSDSSVNNKNYKGAASDQSSGRGVYVRVPLKSTSYEYVRLIRILYKDYLAAPEVTLVSETKLSLYGDYVDIFDGGSTLSGMSIEELNIQYIGSFTAKALEKNNNRLFAANIQEGSGSIKNINNFDTRAFRCNTNGQYVVQNSNGDGRVEMTLSNINSFTEYITSSSLLPATHDCVNPYNINDDKKADGFSESQYMFNNYGGMVCLGGFGKNVSYRIVCKNLPIDYDRSVIASGPNNVACSTRKNFGMDLNPIQVKYNRIIVPYLDTEKKRMLFDYSYSGVESNPETKIPNFTDPKIVSQFLGYQRDEVYRFGVVFYDKDDAPTPVKWIGDIRMPDANTIPVTYSANWPDPEYSIAEESALYKHRSVFALSIGIEFTVKMPAGALRYEIVRVPRTEADKTIMLQCAVEGLFNHSGKMDDQDLGGVKDMRPWIYPSYADNSKYQSLIAYLNNDFTDLDGSLYGPEAPLSDTVKLISPEICVYGDSIESRLEGLKMNYSHTLLSIIDGFVGSSFTPETGSATSLGAASTLGLDGTVKTHYTVNGDNYKWYGKTLQRTNRYALGLSKVDYPALAFKHFHQMNCYKDGEGNIFQYNNVEIKEAKYLNSIPYNEYQNNRNSFYVPVGDKMVLNAPNMIMAASGSQDGRKYGIGGPGVAVRFDRSTDDDINIPKFSNFGTNAELQRFILGISYTPPMLNAMASSALPVYNLKRNIIPYGGNSYSSIQSSIYQAIQTTSVNSVPLTFGGDTYISILDYPHTMHFQNKDPESGANESICVVDYLVFESTINLNLLHGDMIHNNTNKLYCNGWLQLEPVQIQDVHMQSRPYYAYNQVFSSIPEAKPIATGGLYDVNHITHNRIITSEAKTQNEISDSWAKFKIANYLDVDSSYGNITNLKSFKDKLLFFQDSAVGIAAVNERSLVSDGNIGQLLLGTGDILSRYDYISTSYGTQRYSDPCILSTDAGIYWLDYDKHEILSYSGQLQHLSKSLLVQTYINENTPSISDAFAIYCPIQNEIMYKMNDSSGYLVYSETAGVFTSIHKLGNMQPAALNYTNNTFTIDSNYNVYGMHDNGYGNIEDDFVSKLQYIVSDNYTATKVFDTQEFAGEMNNITKLYYSTDKQVSSEITLSDIGIREDTYRLAIPRENTTESFQPRMRGKQLTGNIEIEGEFRLPYINTSYRASMI